MVYDPLLPLERLEAVDPLARQKSRTVVVGHDSFMWCPAD